MKNLGLIWHWPIWPKSVWQKFLHIYENLFLEIKAGEVGPLWFHNLSDCSTFYQFTFEPSQIQPVSVQLENQTLEGGYKIFWLQLLYHQKLVLPKTKFLSADKGKILYLNIKLFLLMAKK